MLNKDLVKSNFSIDAKFSISHIPTVSNSHSPIRYVIRPPTIDPNAAANTIGRARFLSEIIAGVIKTSGGINKNIDSHIVIKNTTHEYQGREDLSKILFIIFIRFNIDDLLILFNTLIIYLCFLYTGVSLPQKVFAIMIKKQVNSNRSEKIASKVQTLVAEILQRNFSDDKLINGVSLVGAESHGGMQYVKIFFYAHDDIDATQKRLDEITKMVRFELAQKIDQKYVPEIRFVYDDTLERANRIEQLLNNLDM